MGFGIKTKFIKGWYMLKYLSMNMKRTNSDELNALLLCHALEKGMGTENVKQGFGQEKASRLIDILKGMQKNKKTNEFSFQESLAVLNAYIKFQREDGLMLSEMEKQVQLLNSSFNNSCRGGYFTGGGTDFLIGSNIDFPSFVRSRHSMRTYSNDPVSNEEILQAIEIAKYSPSACNRQPWHVYYSFDSKKIDLLRHSVPPQAFLQNTPYFCLITADKALFGNSEINQWYINGGIFTSYFILALHHLGIGSVILEFNLFRNTEPGLRDAFEVNKTDEIIAVVGFGKYPQKAKCICAQRRSNEEIAILR